MWTTCCEGKSDKEGGVPVSGGTRSLVTPRLLRMSDGLKLEKYETTPRCQRKAHSGRT